jgi:adenylate cyclase
MLAVLVLYLTSYVLFPSRLREALPPEIDPTRLVLFWSAALGYETAVFSLLTFLVRRKRQLPTIGRFANAFVETSLPTVGILVVAQGLNPVLALFQPPTSFYFVFILLATLRLDRRLCAFTGLVAAVEYALLAFRAVQLNTDSSLGPELTGVPLHIARATVFLLAGIIAGFVASQIRTQLENSFRTVQERNRVVSTFGQHVSPAVVDKLLSQDVELGGEVRYVCLMFLDIRDFTSFSEKRRPEEVVDYLNGLFAFMIESVNRHNGIVNKFLGDGFMAVFGAPIDDGRASQNAVAAALEIVEGVDHFNAEGTMPPTRIGIGLHAGEAVTGNVGSSLRKEYTIIGNVVNLASRIEQLNKQFSSRLLVSEPVLSALNEPPGQAKSLGSVEVRGQERPVMLYQLA